ncbi:MAG: ribonuclease HI family protein [Candidatus Omnitrophica bacterium]|nr:ribonuclease HI family protein [Candidatus Omnitrophota bacterium]
MSQPKLKILSLFIDGAAKGNPGPAGIGVVVQDDTGSTVKNISKYIGNATNNVAEYTALIFGLEEARNLGAEEVTVNTDSELIAKQLGGEYKIKNSTLKELYAKAMKILDSFSDVRVNQIGREENKGADKLANKAVSNADRKVGKSFILKSRDNIPDSLF